MDNNILQQVDVIKKNNSGFPKYLDFDTLRRQGIEYLGKLAGHIWTDHNVHDPGITILESLIYAILDLGYTTNLPVEDILAVDPSDASFTENNFFTPSQILGNNPLTIIDYRKLLIDISEIRNAWLSIEDESNKQQNQIRGLYQVYLDLENPPNNKSQKDFEDEIKLKVESVLHKNRNLCEDFDFSDIHILCKQPVGAEATVELETNADPEQVYLKLIHALREFFTPTPTFYSLQQLINKGKTIDEIFAGRPVNIQQSHGFIDTTELEDIQFIKEFHLSDLFNMASSIPGIKRVRRIEINDCGSVANHRSNGKFHLFKNHVAEFSLDCTTIKFIQDSIPVSIDESEFRHLFELDFQNSGKVLIKKPSPYLDLAIPKGQYRSELDEYQTIQSDFPDVYGIADGGLLEDASDHRKAQALQLKSYLLFYDQLLANYLTQLKNIRNLFSFESSDDPRLNHTYFANAIKTIPELQKLVRLNVNSNDGTSTNSQLLAVPVDKSIIQVAVSNSKIDSLDIEKTNQYYFQNEELCRIALHQVKLDIIGGNFKTEFISHKNGCVFFYIYTNSHSIALLSKSYYKDLKEAKLDVSNIEYASKLPDSFRQFYTRRNKYSFNIEFKPVDYLDYLSILLEDKRQYQQRRNEFLNHLLARFAEKFTDFAQLSYGLMDKHQLRARDIEAKENFLKNYPELSSERGKAYNYKLNGWANRNISGFEKRFNALSGNLSLERRHLCNFELFRYPVYYLSELTLNNRKYFRSPERFDDPKEAMEAARQMMLAAADKSNYRIKQPGREDVYELELKYNEENLATLTDKNFKTAEEAELHSGYYSRIFKPHSVEGDIQVSKHIYFLNVRDKANNIVRSTKNSYPDGASAIKSIAGSVKQINERKLWKYESGKDVKLIGKLIQSKKSGKEYEYIDSEGFKIDVNDTIVGKPDKFTFELLDKNNSFKIRATEEYDSFRQARAASQKMISLLSNASNYKIEHKEDTGEYQVTIYLQMKKIGENIAAYKSKSGAEKKLRSILAITENYVYKITSGEVPDKWKFNYTLGYGPSQFVFESTSEYSKAEIAKSEADKFIQNAEKFELIRRGKQVILEDKSKEKAKGNNKTLSGLCFIYEEKTSEKEIRETTKTINEYFTVRKAIASFHGKKSEAFKESVQKDPNSRKGQIVYQLVDKDNPLAHIVWAKPQPNEDQVKKRLGVLRRNPLVNPNYLEICLGGDIYRKREIKKKTFRYHFQIKCRNLFYKSGKQKGEQLILFESMQGYQSVKDAEEAFKKSYLDIIQKGTLQSNYGKNEYISLKETYLDNEDICLNNQTVAFVPKATLDDLGKHDEASVREIIKLLITYPIIKIDRGDEVYYKYRLVLHSSGSSYFISRNSFKTIKEATKEFLFFIVLLKHPGNYILKSDEHCNYTIAIREVLAESVERFKTEQEAWEEKGIEKFISVSHSPNVFQKFIHRDCYRWFVACRNYSLVHPRKFADKAERDKEMKKLQQAFKNSTKGELSYLHDVKLLRNKTQLDEKYELKDLTIREFDSYNQEIKESRFKQSKIEILEQIRNKGIVEESGELKSYLDKSRYIKISSAAQGKEVPLDQLKEKVLKWAHFNPIVRELKNTGKGGYAYRISIKLPNYRSPIESGQNEIGPCGEKLTWKACPPAWESPCTFNSIDEAYEHYELMLKALSNYRFYLPTYDCHCSQYGIEVLTNPYESFINDEGNELIEIKKGQEIVAYNPQCYSSSEMACEAIERAKSLINTQGLHLIEHVLLRPNFGAIGRTPDPKLANCDFSWSIDMADPCLEGHYEKFIPGVDPYSFIVTVVLPAWSEKYLSPENKMLIEKILYREMPAHILIRVFWLAPHDLCCFEELYKNWIREKAKKTICTKQYNVKQLIQFLVARQLKCYQELSVCPPCSEDEIKKVNTMALDLKKKQIDYLNQINSVHNWPKLQCTPYRYIPCYSEVKTMNDDYLVESDDLIIEKEEIKKQGQKSENKYTEREKINFLNNRHAQYIDKIIKIENRTVGNPLAINAHRFIEEAIPSEEHLVNKIEQVLKNPIPSNKVTKKLYKKEVKEIAENMIYYFLDRTSFETEDSDTELLNQILNTIESKGIDVKLVIQKWFDSGIEKYRPFNDLSEAIKPFLK